MSLHRQLFIGASVLAALAAQSAQAQEMKVSGLVQVWYSQMLDSNLRVNTAAPYYNLRSEFRENGFSMRRTEVKFAGKVLDDVKFEVMIDPSISTSASNPMILQDAAIEWEAYPGVAFKVGQFKNLQTMEGLTSSSEILFAERSQLGRVFGDKRDRGLVASFAFGDVKAFGGKVFVGVFNGMGDAISGKGNDTNAGKDLVARVEMNLGKTHRFGFYTLQGTTDVKDTTDLGIAANPPASWPSRADIYANKDKTTNLGAYYAFEQDGWIATAEVMTGDLGRRFPAMTSGAAPKRQHLDQAFLGYYVTGGYTFGHHTLLARYDVMNYNRGNKWYTAYNPYTETAPGVPSAVDLSPEFKEATLGYTYAFKPDKLKAANLKVNYIHRSKNFLLPNAALGQSGAQGGDTVLVAFQIAF
ncbi:MAG: OprO/OprP family phosphate-selective porin [Firmicutes bacterium]|nr:OprO/OprP family phosphate-selective porin [Bacillota bacterium]